MSAGKVFLTGLRVLAVWLLFAFCFAIAGTLSGTAQRVQQNMQQQQQAQQKQQPAQPQAQQQSQQQPQPAFQTTPGQVMAPFLFFSFCVGIMISYLILRSSWSGLTLVGVMFAAMYGISTISTQVESLFFLRDKMPPGLIGALFLQGTIAMALIAPLSVLVLGKWRAAAGAAVALPEPARLSGTSAAWRVALLVVVFEFLYMFFGYYVAWRNPALRQYYHGQDFSSFFGALKSNWVNAPTIYALQVFRSLLYVACVWPLLRMLRVAQWEKSAAVALFLAAWTTILLLPNPLMPAIVARSHFWETLFFNLIYGVVLGWLLGRNAPARAAATPR